MKTDNNACSAGNTSPLCISKTIGNTPLVRLNHYSDKAGTNVYGKLEFFNPGLSAKDRIVAHMISEAEKSGELKPGGTIVDATSGNTGMAMAMISRMKGYRCILTVANKASKEKVNSLKALGAEVVLCPSGVAPDDPASYYQQAVRISKEVPGAYYLNQNYNAENVRAHFLSTGPEIWNQLQGQVTHLVAAVGTGGTISGTGQYLKQENPNIKVIGVDAYGSVLKKYHETGVYDISIAHSYKMEGVGKSIIPGNVDFDIIDEFVKVGDLKSALRARKLAQAEGLWAGHSSGAALEALLNIKDRFTPDDHVVLILSDHGSKYLSTIYNDEWVEDKLYTKAVVE